MRFESQRVAYSYFVVAVLLFGLQVAFGLLSAAKYLGPDPLLYILPFDVTKVIHTNLLIVWVLTGFMANEELLRQERDDAVLHPLEEARLGVVNPDPEILVDRGDVAGGVAVHRSHREGDFLELTTLDRHRQRFLGILVDGDGGHRPQAPVVGGVETRGRERHSGVSVELPHDETVPERGPFRKLGRIVVKALVTDASAAFDHPARYRVQHGEVSEVVSFTPTYAGQAVEGETIEAKGWLEEDSMGAHRLVVGTSREAGGEWIRLAATSPGSSASPRC